MNVATILELVADSIGERVAVGSAHNGMTYAELLDRSRRVAAFLGQRGAEHLITADVNSEAIAVALFGAAGAGVPLVPVNYRLADAPLRAVIERAGPGLAMVEASIPTRLGNPPEGIEFIGRAELLGARHDAGWPRASVDADDVAVLLFTSGTTGEPKAAVLRHRHLVGYVLGGVEFLGAGPEEAVLVSVPPYHIAGIAAVLSASWSGRRIVYLPQFDPVAWVTAARDEKITHAMVVPTMLGRILDVIAVDGELLPTLTHLSYGGGRMPLPVIERAMTLLPGVGFVNAYGLTETSSTITVLTPEDHRAAFASDDPGTRARLGSVGRPLPGLEVVVRDPFGDALPPGESGEVWVRGDQVSGEYLGQGPTATVEGWFPTSDGGHLDADGFLFVEGRLDDVIVRGGENMSPTEIEDALLAHPAVAEAAVIGVPDDEWGETVEAFVVLTAGADATEADLRQWVRARLRSTRRPARIHFRTELPYSETGKLLRRVLRSELVSNRR